MTRQAYELSPEGPARRAVLECCWVPRDMARRWLEEKRLHLPPWLSSPEGGAPRSAPRLGKMDATPAPRPPRYTSPTPPPASADMQRGLYDIEHAEALLIAEKLRGTFRDRVPTILECAKFLRSHFTGIPSDKHQQAVRFVWPGVNPAPRPKRGPSR
jgi:hypothetical protein